MPTRGFSIILGIVFVLFGVLGFVPALVYPPPAPSSPQTIWMNAGYGALFGVFPVNAVADVARILLGGLGLLAAGSYARARLWCRAIFVIDAGALILGLFWWTRTLFGIMPMFGWNVGFHFVVVMFTFYFAFIYELDRQTA
jgi:hypothetical protein